MGSIIVSLVTMLAPSPRAVSWAKTLTKFVSVQVAVQAMTIASGILLVRALTQTEYAYFTIANSMQATMSILADSGVSIGLSSIGGKIWQSPFLFGQLISTALRLRRYLAVAAVAVITPVMIWLLVTNGASSIHTALLAFAVLAAFYFQLSSGVLVVVPRLHSQINRIQKLDFLIAVMRLALLCAAFFILLNASVAVFVGVAGLAAQYFFLRRWVAGNITINAPVNDEYRSTMIGIVKTQAPNAVFYCLQGQLTIWLISIFGNTENVAEIGALGRLGIIFSIITAVMTSIVLPGFARCQSVSRLRRFYFQIVGGFFLMGICLFFLSVLFPKEILWILGNKYSHLTRELPLMILGAILSAISGAMLSINATKGWVKYYWINIPIIIVLQIILIIVLDMSSIFDVLLFGALSLLPGIIFSAVVTWANLFRSSGDLEKSAQVGES